MLGDTTSELQSLIDLTIQSTTPDASFRAILIVLQQAPDSTVIVDALIQIDPTMILERSLRTLAADLLVDADASELSVRWRPVDLETTESNIVPLKADESAPRRSDTTATTFDDIGGLEAVKKQVRRKIINPFQGKNALFDRFKRKAGGGVLMYGPPGCGKTMLARELASECNARFFNIRAADVLDQMVGNAEKQITQIFSTTRAARLATSSKPCQRY